MKFMRLLLGLLLLASATTLNAQIETRIHQVYEVDQVDSLVVDIPENSNTVNLKETYSTVIIVEMIVTLHYSSPVVLENLVQEGRYKVNATIENGVITIRNKRDNVPLKMNGREIEERIVYNIAVPENIRY